MKLDLDDTIAALASPPGPAARGIVRMSGSNVVDILKRCFYSQRHPDWPLARRASRFAGQFQRNSSDCPLPTDLHLWPTNRSYTGQLMAELHTIGSPPLLEAVLSTLLENDVRLARPGEFTLRAFLAGRVDLVQAEAVLGVIDAHGHEELKLALEQLAGGISGKIGCVRGEIIELLADLEAGLDFADEDIAFIETDELISRIDVARKSMIDLLGQSADRMQSKGHYRVVLAGIPNAGKSTLFNTLVGESQALVSEIEGTTRDYLTARVDWNGTAIELIDTAGWEFDALNIMAHAQNLRDDQLNRADLILWCSPCGLDVSQRQSDDELFQDISRQHHGVLRVQTKSDAVSMPQPQGQLFVSAHAGLGLEELRIAVASRLSDARRGDRQMLGSTAARCRDSLRGCVETLSNAKQSAEQQTGEELVAIELREALQHLSQILGEVYTDDLLDRIFSKFCIGK